MDATTNQECLPSRHVTESPARAPRRSRGQFVGTAVLDIGAVFKKTSCIADLKPVGRYVAKELFEVGGIPLLSKRLLSHGFLQSDCMTVTGGAIAENSVNQLTRHVDA